jgi:hypothetical protein
MPASSYSVAAFSWRHDPRKVRENQFSGATSNRATVQPFLDVRTAVLNETLEDAFRARYTGFRPANDDDRATATTA